MFLKHLLTVRPGLLSTLLATFSLSLSAAMAQDGPTTGEGELGSSDLSILVPLQSYPVEDPGTSVFEKTGTGMCNAPTLDLDGRSDLISRRLWQEWAKDTLLSILPLPPAGGAWKDDIVASGLNELVQKLKVDMNALPDFESSAVELCEDPIGIDKIRTDNVEVLRDSGTHVALSQILPAGACHYKNWRVVAARFEPCSFRASVLSKDPNALNAAKNTAFPASECGGAELRLIIQPFIPNDDGGYTSLDMAIHAFYKLEDVIEFISDLRSFRRATRTVLQNSPSKDNGSVWYADQKNLLIPHPGLREEMDCSNNSQKSGPVGTEWRRLLSKYASESNLFKLTWMTSDNSGANWSFGLRLVQPREGALAPRYVTRLEPFKVETFSISQISRGFPFTPFDPGMKSVDYFYRDGRSDKTLESQVAKYAVKELIDIADPDKTSFNVGGKLGASCASCHTRDQTEKTVRARTGKTFENLAALSGAKIWSIPIWEPIKKSIEKRNDNNLRNFGYGPAMTLGVSRRAVQEAEALRQVVADYFHNTRSPVINKGRGLAKGEVDFAKDVLPILEARCGYCHGNKRAPDLLDERTAVRFSGTIIKNICSDVMEWQHMPPGKILPDEEIGKLLKWFGYKTCSTFF